MNNFISADFLAALIALQPMSYVIRIGLAILAFGAAMNPEKVVARAVGLVWLIITGAALLVIGINNGTVVDIVLGLAAAGAAAFSWWHNRY